MQSKHVVRIKRTIMNLTEILNDVLSISKLEDGGFVSSFENINIKLFLSDIVKDFSQILKKGQSIVHNHCGTNESVTDKKFLRQIIVNLLSNAVKFSPEEGVIELISYISNVRIEIRIRDQGIGISKEDKIHLFEPFFRGSNAMNIEGTGLGLSIVSKYVEMLNGTIEFESELNKGTQFIINLPNHLNYEQESIIN
jgi:signal transduction histidine kinase